MKTTPTSAYKDDFDYQEAQRHADKVAYMGNVKLGLLGDMVKDVLDKAKKGEKSDYLGDFFCPDRAGRDPKEDSPGEWTPRKNQAFMAGAIEASREFVLTSPIEFYRRKIYGTGSEILWLLDNGYTFEPHSAEHPEWTSIKPPKEAKGPHVIREYWIQEGKDWKNGQVVEQKETFAKMDKIVEAVIEQRRVEYGKGEYRPSDFAGKKKQEAKPVAPREEGSWRRAPESRSTQGAWRRPSESQVGRSMSWRKEESKGESEPKARLGSGSPLKRNHSVSDVRKENRPQGSPPKKPFTGGTRK